MSIVFNLKQAIEVLRIFSQADFSKFRINTIDNDFNEIVNDIEKNDSFEKIETLKKRDISKVEKEFSTKNKNEKELELDIKSLELSLKNLIEQYHELLESDAEKYILQNLRNRIHTCRRKIEILKKSK